MEKNILPFSESFSSTSSLPIVSSADYQVLLQQSNMVHDGIEKFSVNKKRDADRK